MIQDTDKATITFIIYKFFASVLLIALSLSSCSRGDDRDGSLVGNSVRFRYLDRGGDRFEERINHVRYLLFDSGGKYLREMEPMAGNRGSVGIDRLEAGSYILVCLGNLGGYCEPLGHTEGGLDSLRLAVSQYRDAARDTITGGDRLYWGECKFTNTPGAANSHVGDLSNIHCLLRIKIEWEHLPEFSSGYQFRLSGIGKEASLSSKQASTIGESRFPKVSDYSGLMAEDVPLRQLSLDATLVTLRWSDDHIPSFQLFNGDSAVTKLIELKPIFESWEWSPSSTPSQEYEMRMTIQYDGSIIVRPGIDLGSGWQDGGTIG